MKITDLTGIMMTIMISLFFLAGCEQKKELSHEKIYVVTTFFPLYDFTKQVGGDKVRVENLLPQGVGPHEFQLRPEDAKKLQDADLLIINGLGLEEWVEEIAKTNKNLMIVNTSVGIEALPEVEGIALEGQKPEASKSMDTHIWLSPQKAMIQVKNIERALIKADPDNRAYYRERTKTYLQELEKLDQLYRNEIASFKSKDFIAFHKAFHYLGKDYGLNQVAVFEEFPGKGPSPRALAQIIDTIKARKIEALFSEPQFSPRIVETIAKDLHLTVYELDPLETGNFDEDHYISSMMKNLETLKRALDGDRRLETGDRNEGEKRRIGESKKSVSSLKFLVSSLTEVVSPETRNQKLETSLQPSTLRHQPMASPAA